MNVPGQEYIISNLMLPLLVLEHVLPRKQSNGVMNSLVTIQVETSTHVVGVK